MVDMLYQATNYMSTEDAMIARRCRPKKRERQKDPHQDRGRKTAQTNKQRDDRRL